MPRGPLGAAAILGVLGSFHAIGFVFCFFFFLLFLCFSFVFLFIFLLYFFHFSFVFLFFLLLFVSFRRQKGCPDGCPRGVILFVLFVFFCPVLFAIRKFVLTACLRAHSPACLISSFRRLNNCSDGWPKALMSFDPVRFLCPALFAA